jgi:hypothetical protein
MKGEDASGEKNGGDDGLCGPVEKASVCEASVKALARDALLSEWYGLWLPEKSTKVSGLSIFVGSSDFVTLIAAGEASFPGGGEVGEVLLGVWVPDPGFDAASVSSTMELLRDFAPIRLFFCLNFSSQLLLFAFGKLSELPTVVAKNLNFSLIKASVNGRPCFW